ncbi:hypothetical protein [Alteribacter natronophilus]|uniref:hypothetical protein n=1 Tax=Alteribacter natronophilus TaxID=2583810 RepID=UPI00110E031A|nr:hypothetical protein [Alteribacter natronophilus]TMW72797.1 hypothetical protein FGB90_00340 [Alteribacter natronophilus]
MEKLKKRLFYLFTGELASACVFTLVYIYFVQAFGTYGSTGLLFSLFILVFILIQGGLYWYVKWQVAKGKKQVPGPQFRRILAAARKVNQILLIAGAVLIVAEFIWLDKTVPIALAVTGVYGFAVIEYINYYHVQLTNYRGGRWKRSSIARELGRSR